MKKLIGLVLTVVFLLGLVGCSSPDDSKQAMLVVSFGTSYSDTREKTLDATQEFLEEEFASYDVYRAFTSQIIIDILEERDQIEVNNVKEAMEALKKESYGKIIVQPLHIMNGAEYDEMVEVIKEYENDFTEIIISKALLSSIQDYTDMVEALATQFETPTGDEAVVFMGHGTHHHANAVYPSLEYAFHNEGYKNVFIGTVEGFPSFEDLVNRLNENNINKVFLMPLMVVAGDHAQNDMAGDEEDSWKVMLKELGFEVEIYMHGIGENQGIRDMYKKHAEEAIKGEH